MLKQIGVGLVCAMLSGCGASGDPEVATLVPVSGKVTLDGKPLAKTVVLFTPRSGTPGTGAFASTDADGNYTLMHRSRELGIQPGEYIVSFSKMALPDGSPIPEGQDAADVGATEQIPSKYTLAGQESMEKPTNTATVSESGGTHNFELTSK
jgi:hypothetical protein